MNKANEIRFVLNSGVLTLVEKILFAYKVVFYFAGCNLTWNKKIQRQHIYNTNAGTFWNKSYRCHGCHGNFTCVTQWSANGCSTVSVIEGAALRLHAAAIIATLGLILHCLTKKILLVTSYRITPAFIRLTNFLHCSIFLQSFCIS